MAVNPLLQRAQDRLATATQAKNDAESALTNAKTDADAKKSTYNQKQSELSLLAQQIELIRKQLALVDSQADAEALAQQLQDKIVASRTKQAEIVAADRDLTKAKTASARAGAAAATARAEAANATSALNEAKTADTRRVGLKTSATSQPVSDVASAATAAEAGPQFTAASNRIQTDIPASLLDLARTRASVEAAVLAAAKKKAVDAITALEAKQSDSDKQSAALARAEEAIGEYVKVAKSRLDEAVATVAKVGDAQQAALSQAEKDSINDPAKLADRNAAAALAKTVATEKAAAIANGVEFEDLGNDPNVQAAEQAFDAASRQTIEGWEAAVPDSTWSLLAQFESARAAIVELKTGPAALITAMENAEVSLAAALTAAASATAALEQLKAAAQDAKSLQAGTAAAYPARVLSALRGDA
jgi:hypothetical protein